MSKCISIEGEYSDHETGLGGEFVCARCFAFDEDAAIRELAESRARFGDSEARRAELEAVIAKVRRVVTTQSVVRNTTVCIDTGMVTRVLTASPSVVLEDRDREVAARTLEDAAAKADRMYAGTDGTELERAWISGVTAVAHRLRERAAAIRKGEHA